MPAPLTLTKPQSQATPYFWQWDLRGTRRVVSKTTGTSRFILEGDDDATALARINSHEGWLSADGRPVHGK